MNLVQSKILNAIETNKLNPQILGERNWYSYFIRVKELVWSRNLRDGYLIEVYDEKHGNHLATITL
ncbi:MAG: hypothetical protein HYU67_03110 [Flavobacteriia bacterium]|nr:hypothetical protein [Flavobacteriia bacterium]